jgi:2-polyprenyl-3-methyl-5-hydroxy-6-metoxy-1,4-benzoquinol methylase
MKEIFDDYVNNSFGSETQAEFKIKQFEYNYRKYFPENLKAKVLDIGIGRGEMLTCMKKWGYQDYLGIDISPSTVSFCKSLKLNCELVDDSQHYLIEHEKQFSVITLLDVLEHIKKEEVVSFLKALRGALKPDGVLIIQIPNSQSPDFQLHRYNDITHEVGYIEHSLAQVLIAAGFQRFCFTGFEDLFVNNLRDLLRKICRSIHWFIVRLLRAVDGNLNPRILNPVLCSIVRK